MQVRDTDSRLHRLEVAAAESAHALSGLNQQLALLTLAQASTAAAPSDDGEAHPMRDKVWSCTNCASRLGIYDGTTDELRVRYKDFICYVRPGAGGVVEVPCRRCGQRNKLEDQRL